VAFACGMSAPLAIRRWNSTIAPVLPIEVTSSWKAWRYIRK